MEREEWGPVAGYEGFYEVSNLGNVRSKDRTRPVKTRHGGYAMRRDKGTNITPTGNGYGYLIVGLRDSAGRKNRYVHRLVAETFLPNPDNKPEIDHINTDKTDNTVWLNEDGSVNYDKTNLRWVTRKGNMNNPLTKEKCSETHKGMEQLTTRGGKHPKAKKVQQFTKDGLFIKEWGTPKEASREMGFKSSVNIIGCCNGRQKTAYGFIWKYVT